MAMKQTVVALLALVPLALAGCPHGGPCSALDAVLAPIYNASSVPGTLLSSRVRGSSQDVAKIAKCILDNGCNSKSCNECVSTDTACVSKCRLNCICGDCYGVKGSSVDKYKLVSKCLEERDPTTKLTECTKACRDTDCVADCSLAFYKNTCECNGASALGSGLGLSLALAVLGSLLKLY